MSRELVTSKVVELLQAQRNVKLGKVERDPIEPNDLPKTAFPAVYVETSNTDIDDISMYAGSTPLRQAVMQLNIVVVVGGKQRDTQRNIAVEAIEETLMSDRTLEGLVTDIRLTRVESVVVGDSAPYTTCRMIFTTEYCYAI